MNYKNLKRFTSKEHFYLTKKGLDGLKEQLDQLRKEQVGLCKRLIGMDAKEREEYIISTDATNKLEVIESEVSKISDILQRADVIKSDKIHSSVELGSTVFLESGVKTINYTLVNSIEADPSANKISEDSPLGRALLGKKEQSVISVSTPRGDKYLYKVLAVK
jgi:transcription elongation factor GreA